MFLDCRLSYGKLSSFLNGGGVGEGGFQWKKHPFMVQWVNVNWSFFENTLDDQWFCGKIDVKIKILNVSSFERLI